jgi:hypothetical protein
MGPNAEDSDTDGDGLVDENFGTLTLADLNQDGASEVTLGTSFRNTNALVYRGSDPVPQNPYAVYSAPNAQVGLGGVRRVAMGDFTGNRRIDAVFTQVDDNNDAALSSRFYRFEGPDLGRFGPEQQIAALEEDVSLDIRDIADLDGNGTQDVVAADAYVSEDSTELRWYANDGTGAFAEQLPIHTFVSEEGEFSGVRVADLNGDGDQDVVWSADDLNKVAWHSNQGDGTFGPVQDISVAAPEATDLAVGDIDGDNDPDVVNVQDIVEDEAGLAWYPNQLGTPDADEDGFGVRRIISSDYEVERPLHLANLDRDGTLDVLFTTEERIRWFRNLGGGAFGDLQMISVGNQDTESVQPADLNRDGRYDVLASGAVVGWYRNEGDGGFDTQSLIGSSPDEDPSLYSAAGDVNADGTIDLVTAESGGRQTLP